VFVLLLRAVDALSTNFWLSLNPPKSPGEPAGDAFQAGGRCHGGRFVTTPAIWA